MVGSVRRILDLVFLFLILHVVHLKKTTKSTNGGNSMFKKSVTAGGDPGKVC